jgi:hypothetical protein
MTYTRPQLALLGEAGNVIEMTGLKPGSMTDGAPGTNPAYDLDE